VLEGNTSEAQRLIDQMKFPCDTSAYYFAHAAPHFRAGDTVKGNQFLGSARMVFGQKMDTSLIDLFSHLGWIKLDVPSPDAEPQTTGLESLPKFEAPAKEGEKK
jgi:hypothetical protein